MLYIFLLGFHRLLPALSSSIINCPPLLCLVLCCKVYIGTLIFPFKVEMFFCKVSRVSEIRKIVVSGSSFLLNASFESKSLFTTQRNITTTANIEWKKISTHPTEKVWVTFSKAAASIYFSLISFILHRIFYLD